MPTASQAHLHAAHRGPATFSDQNLSIKQLGEGHGGNDSISIQLIVSPGAEKDLHVDPPVMISAIFHLQCM